MKQSLKLSLIPVTLMLGACAAVGPDYAGPPAIPAQTGEPLANRHQPDPSASDEPVYQGTAPESRWWSQLADADLDRLIGQALAANTDLRVAVANVNAARAVLRESETGLQPTVDAEGGLTARRLPVLDDDNPDQELDDQLVTAAGLGLAWELDVFGRVRRSIEAADARIGQQEALRDDVERILVASVATAYYQWRNAQERREVVLRNIDNQQRSLELTETLAEEGLVSTLDTARARAQLTTSQALLPSIAADERAALNTLARLLATSPSALAPTLSPFEAMPELPVFVAVGDAASLIRRRPDIREAERVLAALTAEIGVRSADLFPTVSFAGSIGLSSDGIDNLGEDGSFTYSVGPGITWNLFNREAIHARIRQAEARVEAQLARYDGVVLTALEEVDSALVRHLRERSRNRLLQQSVTASREAVDLVKARYNAGAESFLAVLDAERTLLEAEQQLTASRLDFVLGFINVHQALGGTASQEP